MMTCGILVLLDLFACNVQVEGGKLLNIPLIVTEQVGRFLS